MSYDFENGEKWQWKRGLGKGERGENVTNWRILGEGRGGEGRDYYYRNGN
jgi:hypothetical protein